MKQNDSKYHLLYLTLQNEDDWYPKEDRKEVLELIKELYEENGKLVKEKDDEGKYGIRYSTIGCDDSCSTISEQFFFTMKKRDDVYDDWINEGYWDSIFNTELEYPRPSPNLNVIAKVFKEGGKIYEEII